MKPVDKYFIVLDIGLWKIINLLSKYVCKRGNLASVLRNSFLISQCTLKTNEWHGTS